MDLSQLATYVANYDNKYGQIYAGYKNLMYAKQLSFFVMQL